MGQRTVDGAQIYLYSCANSPLLQEERMDYGRPERRAKRCVGVRAICECHCVTQSRGWTWGTEKLWNTRLNTSLVHALSRSAPNSPAILIVTWGIERLEYMSIHSGAKKNYQAGITERVAVGVSRSNVVTRKCCVDVNSTATLSYL